MLSSLFPFLQIELHLNWVGSFRIFYSIFDESLQHFLILSRFRHNISPIERTLNHRGVHRPFCAILLIVVSAFNSFLVPSMLCVCSIFLPLHSIPICWLVHTNPKWNDAPIVVSWLYLVEWYVYPLNCLLCRYTELNELIHATNHFWNSPKYVILYYIHCVILRRGGRMMAELLLMNSLQASIILRTTRQLLLNILLWL